MLTFWYISPSPWYAIPPYLITNDLREDSYVAHTSAVPRPYLACQFPGPAILDCAGLWVEGDHGTILRLKRVMIGKLDRDQRSRVRDQKRKDLRRRWRVCLGGGGLDNGRQGSGIRDQKSRNRGEQGSEKPARVWAAWASFSEEDGRRVGACNGVLED
jgi:hypothetical protein